MAGARAWSLITVKEGQQYAGNRGYADDPRRVYRYDTKVANHRNIEVGHLAFIRDKRHLLGIGQIERIDATPGTKSISRCPACGTGNLKVRLRRTPRYRCVEGHEFSEPKTELVEVTLFAAHFGTSFVDAPDAVPVSRIKAAALRPNDQMSIEEIDAARFEETLVTAFPMTQSLLASFFQANTLDAEEAIEDAGPHIGTDAAAGLQYVASVSDSRRAVLRTIRQRRGQRKFRDALLKRYDSRCVISGCCLVDVLEAAHIWPYRGDDDNNPQNGLLLGQTYTHFSILTLSPSTRKR